MISYVFLWLHRRLHLCLIYVWGFQDVNVVLSICQFLSLFFYVSKKTLLNFPRLPPWSMASRQPPSTGKGRWILGAAYLDRRHGIWHEQRMGIWESVKIDENSWCLKETRICLFVGPRSGCFPGFPELWLLRLPLPTAEHCLTMSDSGNIWAEVDLEACGWSHPLAVGSRWRLLTALSTPYQATCSIIFACSKRRVTKVQEYANRTKMKAF